METEHFRCPNGQWARPHAWLLRPLESTADHPASSRTLIARRMSFFG